MNQPGLQMQLAGPGFDSAPPVFAGGSFYIPERWSLSSDPLKLMLPAQIGCIAFNGKVLVISQEKIKVFIRREVDQVEASPERRFHLQKSHGPVFLKNQGVFGHHPGGKVFSKDQGIV